MLERHAELLRDAIRANDGTEVSTEGDAFFAVFPSAVGGVRAAAAMQRALAAESWPADAPVRIRIGMHTGEAALGVDNYVGMDVNRAARIGAAGHGGQVLMSESTAAIVRGALPYNIRLRDLGAHRLKDLAHPLRLLQLEIDCLRVAFPPIRSLDPATGYLPDSLTSFIGRQRDLEAVLALLAGNRLLTLTGSGGTGKTRPATEAAPTRWRQRAKQSAMRRSMPGSPRVG